MNAIDLSIYPEIVDGRHIVVTVSGNRDGLIMLAKIISDVALADQTKMPDIESGDHYHIHLHPQDQLSDCSCEVQITRADAKP